MGLGGGGKTSEETAGYGKRAEKYPAEEKDRDHEGDEKAFSKLFTERKTDSGVWGLVRWAMKRSHLPPQPARVPELEIRGEERPKCSQNR